MKRKAIHIFISTVTFIILSINELTAQPGPAIPPGGDGPTGGAVGTPLDGGIFSLLLAGLGILAFRKFKRKKES